MSEYPKEVHPEDSGAAGLSIEEMASQISIDQQHDLSGRQWRNRNQNHSCHDKVEPHQQGHPADLHARASQTDNRGDDVDRRSDASKPGDQECESPVIRTMTWG